jgi:hypothetical protein
MRAKADTGAFRISSTRRSEFSRASPGYQSAAGLADVTEKLPLIPGLPIIASIGGARGDGGVHPACVPLR